MTEPVRWRDATDVDPDVRSLLEHATASSDMPSDVDALLRERMASLAKTPPPRLGWPRILGLAGGTGLAVVAALVLWNRTHPANVSGPVEAPTVVVAPSADILPVPVDPPPVQDRIGGDTGAPTPRTLHTPSLAQDTLNAEAQYLERARSKLNARPADALRELEAHATRFPKGQLAAEREYLAIVALHKLGRDADARPRADRFVARYPSSPYVPLVKKLLPGPR